MVIGASTNPERYSFLAINRLLQYGHEVIAIGLKEGTVGGVKIQTGQPSISQVDTITLYINPERQIPLYDYILNLKPRRIIFNPGTENDELETRAKNKGIEVLEACTLVLLGTRQF